MSECSRLSGYYKDFDMLYEKAIKVVKDTKVASVMHIKRELSVGFNMASEIIEQMEDDGLVTRPDQKGRRQLL